MRASSPKTRRAKVTIVKNPTWRQCVKCRDAKPPEEFLGLYVQRGTLERKWCGVCRSRAIEFNRRRFERDATSETTR
jgi:hypothetical protein